MIFAAGLGTRMGALTRDRPKPLLTVGGRALIDHALALARDAAVPRIVVNAHAHADQLAAHLARVAPDVRLSREPERLETGGGLKAALPLLGSGPVFTLNADMVWRGPNPLTALAAAWDPARMGALLALVPRASAIGHAGAGRLRDRRRRDGSRAAAAAATATLVYAGAQIIDAAALDAVPARRVLAQPRCGTRCWPRGGCTASSGPAAGSMSAARRARARRGRARPVTMFPPAAGPRVFGLPPGVDFSRALVAGPRRADGRRAARGDGAGRDLGEHPARAPGADRRVRPRPGPAAAAHPRRHRTRRRPARPGRPRRRRPRALGRRLELARLVAALLRAEPGLAPASAAFDLADSLARPARRDAGRGDRARRARPPRRRGARRALAAQPALPRDPAGLRRRQRADRRAGPDARGRRRAGAGLGGGASGRIR